MDKFEGYTSRTSEAVIDLNPDQFTTIASDVDTVVIRIQASNGDSRPRTFSVRIPAHYLRNDDAASRKMRASVL